MRFSCAVTFAFALFLSGSPVSADFIGHGGMVRNVAISPDGSKVLTASFDYTARLWDFEAQTEIAVFDLHEAPVTGVAFSKDGALAVTTSDDHTAIVWDVASAQSLQTLSGHLHKVVAATINDDGTVVATGAWDKQVRQFSVVDGTLIRGVETNSPVNAVAWDAVGQRLVSGGHHPQIELWDQETGARVGYLDGHRGAITALEISPDGSRLLSSSIDKTIRLWDLATLTQIKSVDVRDGPVFDVAFSPDGQYAVTAGKDGYVVEWDLSTGLPRHEIDAHASIVWSVSYTPNGRFVVSSSSDEVARVWHLETGDRIGMDADAEPEPKPWLESSHPGAKLYPKCAQCHALSADGPSRSGPHFENLYGRRVGTVPGYRYSRALTDVSFEWNSETLFQLFHDGPDVMLPGTKMPVQKISDPEQLSDLVDYLRVISQNRHEESEQP